MAAGAPAEPGRDCPRCPRLVAFRRQHRKAQPDWHNAPVASFGPRSARLLIVGLAPGLRGANRTGRPFTGDFSGQLLYDTLIEVGFARGTYAARPDDGLRLVNARITNAVRCVPPANKPLPAEIRKCNPFLAATFAEMPRLKAVVALGRVAHDAVLLALAVPPATARFAHGALHQLGPKLTLFDSYHCSRQNTNTRRLTPEMFRAIFAAARAHLGLVCSQAKVSAALRSGGNTG
jgi:uracil-DNA glycosylase family 4